MMRDFTQDCACGCGRSIELTEWDAGGADPMQPDGFYDESCQQWFRNECGSRQRRLCEGCMAYSEANALVILATQIRDNLGSVEKPAVALSALRDMIGVEAPLGRRLRRMIAMGNRLDSCDPKTCDECRIGAA